MSDWHSGFNGQGSSVGANSDHRSGQIWGDIVHGTNNTGLFPGTSSPPQPTPTSSGSWFEGGRREDDFLARWKREQARDDAERALRQIQQRRELEQRERQGREEAARYRQWYQALTPAQQAKEDEKKRSINEEFQRLWKAGEPARLLKQQQWDQEQAARQQEAQTKERARIRSKKITGTIFSAAIMASIVGGGAWIYRGFSIAEDDILSKPGYVIVKDARVVAADKPERYLGNCEVAITYMTQRNGLARIVYPDGTVSSDDADNNSTDDATPTCPASASYQGAEIVKPNAPRPSSARDQLPQSAAP
jgi:hypothetical protein